MPDEIVFLFGAGASRGAGHINPCETPLGPQLYERLAEAYPDEWGDRSVMRVFRDGLRENFEKTMFDVICVRHPSIHTLECQQKMALYFSKFTPDGTGEDLYSRLLSALRGGGKLPETIFGSLNYDCILEQAASQCGLEVDYSPGSNQKDAVRLLKLHGSCNFITPDIQKWLPQLTMAGAHLGCDMESLAPTGIGDLLNARFSDRYGRFFPVMSLYAFGKNSLVGGTRIQEIRNTWSQCVSAASLVAIVGVKANPEDHHIWTPVQETKARVLYIGDDESFKAWKAANAKTEHLARTFDQGFEPLLHGLGI